jgi:SAM-dependent methyltransferase
MFKDHMKNFIGSKPVDDLEFDKIYCERIRVLSRQHFTPIRVALHAANFLVDSPGCTVLDIGSGMGKFCFVLSTYFNVNLVGVDFREDFIVQSKKIAQQHQFKRIEFIHSNILDFDLTNYNRLYFFNSFQEQLDHTNELDDSIDRSSDNYIKYTDALKEKLDKLPAGTKIAAYHTFNDQIPFSYKLVDIKCNGYLKFWEKSKVSKRDRFYKELDWIKRHMAQNHIKQ